jgi:ATP synthase protein I
MFEDTSIMLKKTITANLYFGGFITAMIFIFFKRYAYTFAIGLLAAELNMIANTIVTKALLLYRGGRYAAFHTLSFLTRITFVAIIGFVFFAHNIYDAAIYMLGYSSHFVGIFIYSQQIARVGKGSD